MADRKTCDMCGCDVPLNKDKLSSLRIAVANDIDRPPAGEDDLPAFFMGIKTRPEARKVEDFDLCTECATGLLLALKSAKLKVLRGEERHDA